VLGTEGPCFPDHRQQQDDAEQHHRTPKPSCHPAGHRGHAFDEDRGYGRRAEQQRRPEPRSPHQRPDQAMATAAAAPSRAAAARSRLPPGCGLPPADDQ
jgi:hypothetical protein